MNLALLEQKNLVNACRQAQKHQSKIRKKSWLASKKSKLEKNDFDLRELLKAVVTGVAKAFLLAALFYVAFMSYRFITSSLYFNINNINWFGHNRLSTQDLNLWIGPMAGKNIFQLDLDKVSQKLAKHPWVETASARRAFPHSIHVELKERTPFARIQLDQVYVMDNYGILLGLEEKQFNGLPLITGVFEKNRKPGDNVVNEKIIRGLKIMYYLNRLPMFKENPTDTMRIRGQYKITFATKNRGMEIHMRPEMTQENFKNLMLVLGTIEESGKNLSYIDLSFKNKIIVKHNKNLKNN